MRTNLDIDVLRTFVVGFDLGSFAKAAERLGRSPSAVSTQLRRLEDQVGHALVRKAGRGLALTGAGERLLGYAKRILELNDEAVETVRGDDIDGCVRLGLPPDFAEAWLPEALGRFVRLHPKVRIEVRVERNVALVGGVAKGDLDLALAWDDGAAAPNAAPVAALPLAWIGRSDWPGLARPYGEPLALVALEQPCVFRAAALASLDAAAIPWRLAFTSSSLSGLWAAALAGLGVTLRTPFGLPAALSILDAGGSKLPRLPSISVALHFLDLAPSPAVQRLAAILREIILERTGHSAGPLIVSRKPSPPTSSS